MTELIGVSVVVPGANRGTGILKFVGQIRGKAGTFGGIELQGPGASSRGKNNGDVEGTRYFDVSQPMAGLFLPWDRLRAANPSLPAADRLKTRSTSSKRDSVYTPTPSRRSSPSPRVFNGHSSLSGSSQSFSRTNSFSRDTRRSSSVSKTGPDSPFAERITPRAHRVQTPDSNSELADLRAQIAQKSSELERKDAILLDLQTTVDQLQPVLEDYEQNLEDKERRLKKQRGEYEKAREEWRSSLDLMLSSQQEAENLYEIQISDLKEELQKVTATASQSRSSLGPNNDSDPFAEELALLKEENELLRANFGDIEQQLEKSTAENARLKSETDSLAASTKTATGGENCDDELVESLKKKVHMLTQDVSSMEMVLQDAQAKTRAKNNEIAELEIKLEELTQQDVQVLSDRVEGISLEDWERDKKQYESKIDELETNLKAFKTKTEASAESSEADISELARLRESEATKSMEITNLQEKISALEIKHSELTDSARSVQQSAPKEESENLAKIAKLTEEQETSRETIRRLKEELDTRPPYNESELTELQNSLEMVESLHEQEMEALKKKNELAEKENTALKAELQSLQTKVSEPQLESRDLSREQPVAAPQSMKPIHSEISSVTQTSAGSLPIYKPANTVDPSEGRDDWCGLCERDGHDSLNCPYENDMF